MFSGHVFHRVPGLALAVPMALVLASGAFAATYELGPETELLDAEFYVGQSVDGSDVAGRMAFFGTPSRDGGTVAFWAVNMDTFKTALFLVDVGDPFSWRRLSDDLWDTPTEFINWTPDNLSIITRRNQFSLTGNRVTPIVLFGYSVFELSMTSDGTGNWGVTVVKTNPAASGDRGQDLLALPILANGLEDSSREPVFLTDMGQLELDIDWPMVRPEVNSLVLLHQPWEGWTNPWEPGDVLEITGLQDILDAPKRPGTDVSLAAVESLSDPRVIPIEDGLDFGVPSGFSADGSLVFYSEDWNQVFIGGDQFFVTMPLCDFDVMIANADGSGTPARLVQSGNQAIVVPTPGGTRLVYMREQDGVMHLFVTTLVVSTEITGTAEGDNDIRTTTEQQVSDTSGTVVTIPDNIVVDFPVGAPQEIQITTPIDPATEPQLPEAAIPPLGLGMPEIAVLFVRARGWADSRGVFGPCWAGLEAVLAG